MAVVGGMLAFMHKARLLFLPRSLVMLALACAILLSTVMLLPRYTETWPGSDREHHESDRFVKALHEHFEADFEWNMPAKGSLCVMAWGIANERKQNEIRDWAIAEKNRTGLELTVRIEFYENELPNEPGHWNLLRVVEF